MVHGWGGGGDCAEEGWGDMKGMVRGSSLVLLPDVGHFAPLQDPGTFNAMLDRWLARARG